MKFGNQTNFEYSRFDGNIHLSCYGWEINFFRNVGPKNQNYCIKFRVGT